MFKAGLLDPRNLALDGMGQAMFDLITRIESRNVWLKEGWLDPGSLVLDVLGQDFWLEMWGG